MVTEMIIGLLLPTPHPLGPAPRQALVLKYNVPEHNKIPNSSKSLAHTLGSKAAQCNMVARIVSNGHGDLLFSLVHETPGVLLYSRRAAGSNITAVTPSCDPAVPGSRVPPGASFGQFQVGARRDHSQRSPVTSARALARPSVASTCKCTHGPPEFCGDGRNHLHMNISQHSTGLVLVYLLRCTCFRLLSSDQSWRTDTNLYRVSIPSLITSIQYLLQDLLPISPGEQYLLQDLIPISPGEQVQISDLSRLMALSHHIHSVPVARLHCDQSWRTDTNLYRVSIPSLITSIQYLSQDLTPTSPGEQYLLQDLIPIRPGEQVQISDLSRLMALSHHIHSVPVARLNSDQSWRTVLENRYRSLICRVSWPSLITSIQFLLQDSIPISPGEQFLLQDSIPISPGEQVQISDLSRLMALSHHIHSVPVARLNSDQSWRTVLENRYRSLICRVSWPSLITSIQFLLQDSIPISPGEQFLLQDSIPISPGEQVQISDLSRLMALSHQIHSVPVARLNSHQSWRTVPVARLNSDQSWRTGTDLYRVSIPSLITSIQYLLQDLIPISPGEQVQISDLSRLMALSHHIHSVPVARLNSGQSWRTAAVHLISWTKLTCPIWAHGRMCPVPGPLPFTRHTSRIAATLSSYRTLAELPVAFTLLMHFGKPLTDTERVLVAFFGSMKGVFKVLKDLAGTQHQNQCNEPKKSEAPLITRLAQSNSHSNSTPVTLIKS
ncbi:hypothetical protein RRG08_005755 [Elysia crispata]|uniref:Uncharacterized protein n=1 Tax=Elysia crispata TaxID=231223 RepID=A0AAE1CWB7_9GAST|nr:hypothetical protein RRG08_005755 [Elysia crispata]